MFAFFEAGFVSPLKIIAADIRPVVAGVQDTDSGQNAEQKLADTR